MYCLDTMKIERAKRLIRELEGRRPSDLLQSKSYRHPQFLPLLFAWIDDLNFHDPLDARSWAEVGVELAGNAPRPVRGTAYVTLASTLRACGDHDAADAAYEAAEPSSNRHKCGLTEIDA